MPTLFPCGECSKQFKTYSGRSKHRIKVHGHISRTVTSRASSSSSPGTDGRGPNSSGPSSSGLGGPGLEQPEVSLTLTTQSGERFTGRTRLGRVDSVVPIGSPRYESTRVDLSETCESESTGPSDDSADPDWVE